MKTLITLLTAIMIATTPVASARILCDKDIKVLNWIASDWVVYKDSISLYNLKNLFLAMASEGRQNCESFNGATPLIVISNKLVNVELIAFFIDKGADPNHKFYSKTAEKKVKASYYAKQRENWNVYYYLLNKEIEHGGHNDEYLPDN
ncbi:MAG: hypothetical protein ACNYPH_02625 [Gammaproteobacteria bacterium WSBS_2016_MAG_OTU1]